MKTLAIIGTAGRRQDILHLSKAKYETMIECARHVVSLAGADHLVSGGAAWADHVALELEMPLKLWLPARKADLATAALYHGTFSRVVGYDTWTRVLFHDHEKLGGFKDRNCKVAEAADVWLAMTFGNGPVVKDGGTSDTVAKMAGKPGYHLDLWTDELWEI